MKKIILLLSFLTVVCFPTFTRMLKVGIYSMQDFHYFRLVEFGKCISDGQIPCRWSADSGLGYGEPLFNFYGQLPYLIGEIIHVTGFSQIDSLKILFIFSLIGSATTMFILAKKLWHNNYSALVASAIYVYAPYRAVDVWVRGALPEAMSFVLFPLIFLFLERLFGKNTFKNATLLGISLALLILTHNLSVVMFLPLLGTWSIFRFISKRKVSPKLLLSIGVAFLLSSFYVLPVIFESQFIDIESTTKGYFDFRAHFTTTSQLLLSNFWGYGGSTFGPEDGLNLSIGYIQWLLPVIAILILLLQKKLLKYKDFLVLFFAGWVFLFLTHGRSTPIWITTQDIAKYIQFPWRFLSIALFCFSLSSGIMPLLIKKYAKLVSIVVAVTAIIMTQSFFREDIWYEVADQDLTQGLKWEEQTRASIGDFWPKASGPIPSNPAPKTSDDFELLQKSSNKVVFKIKSNNENIVFPINDKFPGWKKEILGDIATFTFTNTPVRTLGNLLSILGLAGVVAILIKYKSYES